MITAQPQLSLFPPEHDADSLRMHFEAALRRPVNIRITDNSTSLFSARQRQNAYELRLHHMFLKAPEPVLHEIGAYARRKSGSTPLFWQFVNDNRHLIKQGSSRRTQLNQQGQVYHLGQIFEAINERYFGGAITCEITWGRKPSRRRTRLRTLGSYRASENMIRINPVLDKKTVPRYYVEYVVHHEMVHAHLSQMESTPASGVDTHRLHGPLFNSLESRFEHYARALEWESRKLV